MTALVEIVFFFVGFIVLGSFFLRVCQEGDYDDYYED